MKSVTVYTDGACSKNPGPGGWGCILIYGSVEKELSGAEPDTTNNRMELTAAIRALSALKLPCEVKLYTDSAYLCNALEKHWLDAWQRSGWRTASKSPVMNRDLWEELIGLTQHHSVQFMKVKGHSSDTYNNRCDKLARDAIKRIKNEPDTSE